MKNIDKLRLIQCDKCGKTVADIGFVANNPLYRSMFDKCFCQTCTFWSDIRLSDEILSVDGLVLKVLPFQEDPPPGATLGGNGKVRYFLTKNGKAIKSNDVWLIGKPPLNLIADFPTNAYSITRKAYERLANYRTPCVNERCQDRLRCFYYDWKRENFTHPISNDHTPGSQPCCIFLPYYWIRNYNVNDSKQFQTTI